MIQENELIIGNQVSYFVIENVKPLDNGVSGDFIQKKGIIQEIYKDSVLIDGNIISNSFLIKD